MIVLVFRHHCSVELILMNCYMFVSVGKHNTPDVCYVGDNIGSFYSYFFMDFF